MLLAIQLKCWNSNVHTFFLWPSIIKQKEASRLQQEKREAMKNDDLQDKRSMELLIQDAAKEKGTLGQDAPNTNPISQAISSLQKEEDITKANR